MCDLVREHDFDLLIRVLGQHGVRHEDAPRRPKTGQRRVRLLRLVAQAPFVRAKHAGAGALGEREQPRAQRFAIERLQPVEERQQQNRRKVGEADGEQRVRAAGREPPPLR